MADSGTSAAARLLNKTVGGFELLSVLGQGGMGTVYKARQTGLDRIVALKILSPKIADNQAFITRFQREARASAKLNHPNVVQGIDVGHDDDHGVWYFAMEFVDGPSVLSVLEDTGKIPEIRALEIVRDVAEALECAHKNGIVHRDVKPDNILLTLQGQAKLADLGLARHVEDNAGVTAEDRAIGTPLYMAPEQARGDEREIDIRTDLYALGATLYHLVTGKPPFEGKTAAVIMTKHITDAPPLAHVNSPGVNGSTARLIEKLMQKKREDRVQSPAELLREIKKLTTALKNPQPAPATGRSGRNPKPRTVSVRMGTAVSEAAPAQSSSSRNPKSGVLGESTKSPGSVPVQETKSSKASSRRMPAVPASKPSIPALPRQPENKPSRSDLTAEPPEAPVAKTTTPSRAPQRISMADRRKKDQADHRKRTLEGMLVDLVVLAVVLGLLAAGVIYMRSRGYLQLPSEKHPAAEKQSVPAPEPKPQVPANKTADPEPPAEPAKTGEPAAPEPSAKSEAVPAPEAETKTP